MTDPRRRRHINAPSAPKKKEASPDSYKMSRPAEGRKEVPKPKPEPSRSEGRQQQGNRSSGQPDEAKVDAKEATVVEDAINKVDAHVKQSLNAPKPSPVKTGPE